VAAGDGGLVLGVEAEAQQCAVSLHSAGVETACAQQLHLRFEPSGHCGLSMCRLPPAYSSISPVDDAEEVGLPVQSLVGGAGDGAREGKVALEPLGVEHLKACCSQLHVEHFVFDSIVY
jgi:hypothetical protein